MGVGRMSEKSMRFCSKMIEIQQDSMTKNVGRQSKQPPQVLSDASKTSRYISKPRLKEHV